MVPNPQESRKGPLVEEEWEWQGLTQIQIRGPSQCGPLASNGRQQAQGRGYSGRGITHLEVRSQEEGGEVIRAPNTSLTREVQDVQDGVVGHKGTCAVGG